MSAEQQPNKFEQAWDFLGRFMDSVRVCGLSLEYRRLTHFIPVLPGFLGLRKEPRGGEFALHLDSSEGDVKSVGYVQFHHINPEGIVVIEVGGSNKKQFAASIQRLMCELQDRLSRSVFTCRVVPYSKESPP